MNDQVALDEQIAEAQRELDSAQTQWRSGPPTK